MAYNRGKEERERLFASSGNYGGGQTQFNSHTNKQTALDMEGVHYDKLNRANASTYFLCFKNFLLNIFYVKTWFFKLI